MNVSPKRLLSLLMAVILVIGLPVSVMAANVDGDTDITESTITKETENPSEAKETIALQADYVSVEDPGENSVSTMADVYATLGTCSALDLVPKNTITLRYTDAQGASHYTRISRISWHYVNTEENIIICLEPDKSSSNGSGHSGDNNIGLEGSGGTVGKNAWYSLTFDQRRAIALVLLYGCPNGYWDEDAGVETTGVNPNKGYRAATQAIVWEIVAGMRSPVAPYDYTSISNAQEFWDQCSGVVVGSDGTDYFQKCYTHIINCLVLHDTVPSFTGKESASVPTIELTGETTVVTDTNGVLSRFEFINTSDVSFAKSNNNLTIRINGSLTSTSFVAYAEVPNPETSVYQLWYNGYTSQYQTLIKLQQVQSDPIPAYFQLNTATSNLNLIKITEDAQNLAGWIFSIYSDASCETLISGPHTTDSGGNISITDLRAGTVYVKELGHSDPEIDSMYVCDSPNPQQVTICSGETAEVTFSNNLRIGYVKIVKQTNTGKNLSGWQFNIYADAACTQLVDGSPFTTSDDGEIIAEVLPGDYFVVEVDASQDYPDWEFDTAIHVVNVNAGETAVVTCENIQLGRMRIKKTMPDGGCVSGWEFEVYRVSDETFMGSFISGEDGTILIGQLQPGDYRIVEKITENSTYYCEAANPQTVTVIAGQTAEVTFTNRLKPAEISILKVDTAGNPLTGAVFLLEWSVDGANWLPVSSTDSSYVTEGTCTSEGLLDGCLTSPENGLVQFTGLHPERYYRLTEISAPDGYQLLAGAAFEGTIPTDEGLNITLTVINAPVYELPMTGSKSFAVMSVSLCICITGCAGALVYRPRKEQ